MHLEDRESVWRVVLLSIEHGGAPGSDGWTFAAETLRAANEVYDTLLPRFDWDSGELLTLPRRF